MKKKFIFTRKKLTNKFFVTKIFLVVLLLSSKSFAGGFFSDLEETFTGAFDKEGLIILAAGTAATVLAFTQDQAMHDTWSNHQRMSADVSRVGDFWGQGYVEGGIAIVQLIWDRENGLAHTEGLISSSAVVYAAKYAIGRARPDSDTKTSFPSGHTQFSFATATSLTESYGWGLGAPLYGMAVFTGFSRLSDDAHWFSDVVAGATVGVLFARSAAKHHRITITPSAFNPFNGSYGLQISYIF